MQEGEKMKWIYIQRFRLLSFIILFLIVIIPLVSDNETTSHKLE